MTTALDLITRSMKLAGVLGSNETPKTNEANDGLNSLNDMLASWSTDVTYVYSVQQQTFPLVTGQAAYTFGPGGNFPIRPSIIDSAFIRMNNIDYPLMKIESSDYANIAFKGKANFPQYFFYNQGFPQSTMTIWGTPSIVPADLFVNSWTRLDQFANLTTDITFPPGYQRAIIYNLAIELAPLYGMPISAEVAKIATDAAAKIRELNLPEPVLKTEIGILVGWGDNRSYITGN